MSQLNEIEIANATNNTGNITSSAPPENEIVQIAFHVVVIAVQITIMLSMGAIITIQDIFDHFKRPISILIALTSQFVAMPASAFGLVNLAQLPTTIALSAMILACCPGGSSSNLFTYFCDGDVPLSIMLTTISTVLAMGFMPLNLWIYTRQWELDHELNVPYKAIAVTLAWILLPLAVGMVLKKFAPKFANIINQVGSVLGMLLIWIGIILQYILYPEAFQKGWKLWLIAAAIPSAGFFLGYCLAFIAKQPSKQRKTISLETGMQSISLAVTIVITSFPAHMHGDMTPLMTMCGIYLNGSAFILAAVVRIPGLFNKRKTAKITPVDGKNQKVVSTIT